MFSKGDYVYYASGGICRIDAVEYAPLEGMPSDRLYYVMHSLHDPNGVIYLPVDCETVFFRRVLTKEEAEDFLREIPNVPPFAEPNAKSLRSRYQESMKKHDPLEWLRIIKTVHGRMQAFSESRTQRVSETERSIAEDAKRFLYTELSVALNVPAGNMEDYIRKFVDEGA